MPIVITDLRLTQKFRSNDSEASTQNPSDSTSKGSHTSSCNSLDLVGFRIHPIMPNNKN